MKQLLQKFNDNRWVMAWLLAIVFHVVIVAVIAQSLRSDTLVRVVHMIPAPNGVAELLPAQAVEAIVGFSSQPEILQPSFASLYRIDENGARVFVSHGHLHPSRRFAIQFDAVSEDGVYEIEIQDAIVASPYTFDGEMFETLPSGDGEAGGAFRARFRVAHTPQEVFTARMYDPDKPQMNEEAAKPSQATPEQQPSQPKLPAKRPRPRKVASTKPQSQPQQTAPEMIPAPEMLPPTPDLAPAPRLTPQQLRVSPTNLSPTLMQESQAIAAQNFAERDVHAFVKSAQESKARYESAYAESPVIGPGQEGNSLSHQKDVAEYLALMHKEIHPRWAHDYLLRLDTVYRRHDARLDHPDLEAVLEITLDSLGKVSDVRMVRSSGITDYDSEAIHVAWNSSPGVPIPNEMRSNNGKGYVHWTFWRDGRQCGVFGVKVFKYEGNKRDALDFSLKAVQLQEKKLGLTPSTLDPSLRPRQNTKTNDAQPSALLPEKINPIDD